jgi:hypothetical protein
LIDMTTEEKRMNTNTDTDTNTNTADMDLEEYVLPLVVMVRARGVDRHDAVNRATRELSHVLNLAGDGEHPDGTLRIPVERASTDTNMNSKSRVLPPGYQGSFDFCAITTIEGAFTSGHVRVEATNRSFRGY